MKGVKWVKLDTGIFDSEKIRLIESMPDGDMLVVIWIKLIALAGKQGATGELLVAEGLPYTDEMLSVSLARPLPSVRLALDTFRHFGMIYEQDGTICLTGWDEYQATGGSSVKRAERNHRYYLKQKEGKELPATDSKALPEATEKPQDAQAAKMEPAEEIKTSENSHEEEIKTHQGVLQDVLQNENSDALEIEIRDKSKEIKKHCREKSLCDAVVGYLNAKTGKNFRPNTKQTRALISARLSEGYQLADFETVIDYKCAQWLKDAKLSQYLQPSTLFAPSHFDQYLANAQASSLRSPPADRFSKFG